MKKLKMPQVAKTYESLAREAADNNLDYEEYLLCVLEQEVHQRENNRIQRGIRQAGFPVIKTIESFDFLAIPSLNKPRVLKLMQGEYIRRRENVILIGNSGVGKTHIATALGYEACRQGMKVKFYTAAGLINELLAAQQEYRLNKLEKQWLAPHLVILDELAMCLSVKSEQNCCSSSALPDMRGQPDHNYKLRISKMDGGVRR